MSDDYGLIENCSNLVNEEKRCLDTWDDEHSDYKKCEEINCQYKQLKWLEAENEKLKKEIEKMRIECAECDLKNLGSEE